MAPLTVRCWQVACRSDFGSFDYVLLWRTYIIFISLRKANTHTHISFRACVSFGRHTFIYLMASIGLPVAGH